MAINAEFVQSGSAECQPSAQCGVLAIASRHQARGLDRALQGVNRIGDGPFCLDSNKEIVWALTATSADFLVIGGLAISWHFPERQADDMDLLVNPTPDNSKRIAAALATLGLSGFGENSFARLGLQIPLKQQHYAELLTPSKDGPSFEESAADAVEVKLFNIPVRVASVKSLVRLKEHAVGLSSEPKHQQDLELLRSRTE